ncbi:uncharacterized protein AMSG_06553 [Thecamonas trahens ATCC 50062]|uniref:tubulin-glutamate carboxypeptidase n=1 Tax=Thecamonas trahens ATCC 50062 TaxID=461836 RepID=A0A0L0DFX0_THETB|nr:hypothetical protein AMSG_06553 [Thecamonas trahens ATCC 50062]KNC51199.1 hypothetical protein AMSG_06553 [Thecamonas trahens ATCC 50062]|eukprot:XP_013756399.1 hypothetical protein AMSG_06553 [Thecamonas trahens ATCC 50062]
MATTVGRYTISSAFESGNASGAAAGPLGENDIHVWTARDGAGSVYASPNRSWFFFSISNLQHDPGATNVLRITIRDLNGQAKLYSAGYRPFYRVGSDPHAEHGPGARWLPIPSPPAFYSTSAKDPRPPFPDGPHRSDRAAGRDGDDQQAEKRFALRFEYVHRVPANCAEPECDTVFFAFCVPHSLTTLGRVLDGVAGNVSDDVFFAREILAYSLDGRPVELVTVTSADGADPSGARQLGTYFTSLAKTRTIFPAEGGSFGSAAPLALRPPLFPAKKYFFVSARVHPGETPASHMMDGLLKFLVSDDPRAKLLRGLYVFCLVPAVNPDGVARGHYRTDPHGVNLNRVYDAPSVHLHPTVAAIRTYLVALTSDASSGAGPPVDFYIDLHSHASRKGIFVFGNALDAPDAMLANVLYAKLLEVNSPHFELDACDFSSAGMAAVDKRDGMSKAGSGRVGIHAATGIRHCYTLESNYHSGNLANGLAPAANADAFPQAASSSRRSLTPPRPQRSAARYTPEIWRHIGKTIAIAALDLAATNPFNRLELSAYGSLAGARSSAAAWLRKRNALATAKARSTKAKPPPAASSAASSSSSVSSSAFFVDVAPPPAKRRSKSGKASATVNMWRIGNAADPSPGDPIGYLLARGTRSRTAPSAAGKARARMRAFKAGLRKKAAQPAAANDAAKENLSGSPPANAAAPNNTS